MPHGQDLEQYVKAVPALGEVGKKKKMTYVPLGSLPNRGFTCSILVGSTVPMPPGQATACRQALTVTEAWKPAGHTFLAFQETSFSPQHLGID